MVAYTTTYNLKKPTVADDEDVWGGYLNDSMDIIDDVLDGTVPVTGIDINSGTIDNAVIGGTTAAAGTFTTLSATTSLGVTGNITVSGTVDGRDVAADGTKLDGIESGATADQTASEILTAIKTVDGAGSGLDADTLDGNQATAFYLATNPSGYTTNTGTVTSASMTVPTGFSVSGSPITTSGTFAVSYASGYQGYTSTEATKLAGIETGATADQTASEILTAIKTVDGSGSGLDADVLDGQQGTYYLDYNNFTNTPTISTDAQTLDGLDSTQFLRSDASDSATGTITFTGSIRVGSTIYHDGDTDTYISFGTNTINFNAGGTEEVEINTNGLFIQNSALHEDYDSLSGTSPSVDPNNGGAWSLTMSGNTTFTFGSTTSGYSVGFIIQLTGNGSTVTWPSSVDWAGGTAPDAPASGETDIYVFWTRDGGSTWYGVLSIDAAA